MFQEMENNWVYEMLPDYCREVAWEDDFPFKVLKALIKYLESGEIQKIAFDVEGEICTFAFGGDLKVDDVIVCRDIYKFADAFVEEIGGCLMRWNRFPPHGYDDSDFDEFVELSCEVLRLIRRKT